jgi:hypothetical protein
MTDNLKGYIKEINRHGTRCAGEVSASANNGVCVPGKFVFFNYQNCELCRIFGAFRQMFHIFSSD